MKVYNKREFANILSNNGYKYVRCRGSHFIYRKESETIAVPKNLNKMISKRLIKENNLSI